MEKKIKSLHLQIQTVNETMFCSIVVYNLCARSRHGIPGILNLGKQDLSHLAYTFLDISGAEWEVKH